MDVGVALTTEIRIEARLSPDLVAFVQSLTLPVGELEEQVEQELAANPALERVDPGRYTSNSSAGDPLASVGARPSWRDQLVDSARLLCAPDEAPLVELVVGSLDKHGLLSTTPETIAGVGHAELTSVKRAIEAVRRAGPPGIATMDARESLLAQLDALGAGEAHPQARPLVDTHLAALARGRFGSIARALGVPRDEVLAARDFICARLRPWPAPSEDEPVPVVMPDVVVEERQGDLHVELAESACPRLRINPLWERAVAQARSLNGQEGRCARTQVLRARSFVSRLRRRERTLLAVARCVVDAQREYVLRGPRFARPLTRAQVAAELGVHESTVGRAVAGKFVLLPSGRLLPLTQLFDSAAGVREELARIVAQEPRPMSDADLAAELSRRGCPLSRRAVAKYRARQGIPAQALR